MATKSITIVRGSVKILFHSALLRTNLRCSTYTASTNSHIHGTVSEFEALVRSRCVSGNLELDEAEGYFNSLLLIRPFPDIWSFNHLFGSLSNLGHYSLVVSMYRVVSVFGDFRPRIGTLTTVMNCFFRLEQFDLVFSVLATTLKLGLRPTPHTLTILLHMLSCQGALGMAIELFDEIVCLNLPCNEFTYATIINGLCQSGDTPRALHLLRKMCAAGGRVHADAACFAPVIDAFCKEGRADVGLALFSEMVGRGVAPNVVVCNSLIHGLCRCGCWDDAKRLFADMTRKFGVSPDVRTYNVVIDALCKEDKCWEAVRLFELMVGAQLVPSVVTFSSLVSCFCRCGFVEEGARLFGRMPTFGVFPNILMFTALFDAMCKKGMIKEALSLIKEMVEIGVDPNVFIYTSLIQGFCRFSRVDLGFSVLATMVKRGIEADACVLSSLLRGLCGEGLMALAMKFFRQIVEKEDHLCNEDTYAVVIHGLCKVEETSEAVSLLNRVCENPRMKPEASCYNPVIQRFCKEDRMDEALQLFDTMINRGILPDEFTCNPLIEGLCRSGRWEEANRIMIHVLHVHGVSPDLRTYDAVVDSLSNKINTREAIPLLKSITGKGGQPNVVTFNSLLSALCERGQRRNNGLEVSGFTNGIGIFRDKLKPSDVNVLCKKGRITEALNLVEEMENRSIQSDVKVYNSLIRRLCNSGRWWEAVRCLEKMEDQSILPTVETFTVIADSLNMQSRNKEALMLLKDMVEKGLVPVRRTRKLLKRILAKGKSVRMGTESSSNLTP